MELLTDLIVLTIRNEIIYAFSKKKLKLYRLKYREELGIEIGMFITFEKTDEFVMDVTSIIEKRSPSKSDHVRIETSENGPFVVLTSWMVFSRNSSLRSHKMVTGFSDWYGYIRIIDGTMKKSIDSIYAVNIIVDDLEYDQKHCASLFRQHLKWVGKRDSDTYKEECEDCETKLKSRDALESYPDN